MEFDSLLTRQAHEEGAEINIINPNTGEKTDVYIKVMGVDSSAWRQAMKAAVRRMVSPNRDDDLIDDDAEKLASITIAWRGITRGGKPLEFSKKECKELYIKSPALMDQVDRFVANYRNFTKG